MCKVKRLTKFTFIAALFLSGCGPRLLQNYDEQGGSILHYIPHSSTANTSLRFAREDKFKICTTGSKSPKMNEWSRKAALIWLRAVRVIDEKVTRNVEINCDAPHLTVNLIFGNGTSMGGPGYLSFYTGERLGELVHEMGHALAGLADTYSGQAGVCQSGQPQSNMCWGAFGPRSDFSKYSGLWPDDIKGIQRQYRRIFKDLIEPSEDQIAGIYPEGPLDLKNPWPLHFKDIGNELYYALKANRGSNVEFLVSAPSSAKSVMICEQISTSFEGCLTESKKYTLTLQAIKQTRAIFQSQFDFVLNPLKSYRIIALKDNNLTESETLAVRTIKFLNQ
jgi:hypothetical protein